MTRKPLTGVLFRSTSDNPRAPVLSGYIVLADETELRVSGWYSTDQKDGTKRLDKNGHPYLNLKLEPREEQQQKPQAEEPPPPDDDDLPF